MRDIHSDTSSSDRLFACQGRGANAKIAACSLIEARGRGDRKEHHSIPLITLTAASSGPSAARRLGQGFLAPKRRHHRALP